MNVSTPNGPPPPQAPDPGTLPANGSASSHDAAADSPNIAVNRQIFVSHLEIKTPDGQSYLEGGARKLVKADSEPLAQFLADAEITRGGGPLRREVTLNYSFGGIPKSRWRQMKFVTPGMLDAFEKAAQEFYRQAHAKQNAAQFQRQARMAFRLPDPDLEPESYWLVGDRFEPKLVVLWGCEKLDVNKRPIPSLPLVKDAELFPGNPTTVVDKLRARLLGWEGILQENLDLIADKKEPLGRFIARPVYDPQRQQIVALRPILAPDAAYPISKFRPLKKIPTAEIAAFDKAAADYYAKAHEDSDAREAYPDITPYEREIRRNFRLPDVELATSRAGQVLSGMEGLDELINGQKKQPNGKPAAKKKSDAPRISYWVYGKRLSKRLMVCVEGNEPIEQCLYLRRDEALDIPPGSKGKIRFPQTAGLGLEEKPETVVEKLWLRELTWIARSIRAAAVLAVLGLLAFIFLQFIYVRLSPTGRAVLADAKLDPDNLRNIVVVKFNAAINPDSIPAVPEKAIAHPPYLLQGPELGALQIKSVKLDPENPKQLLFYVNRSVPDGPERTEDKILLNGLRPKFGRVLRPNTPVEVETRDTRPPAFAKAGSWEDSEYALELDFDEALDRINAESIGNYTLTGPGVGALRSAQLQKDRKTVVLKADKAFEPGANYTLALKNIRDASNQKNAMPDTTTNFIYVQIPLALKAISAADQQNRIKIQFNRTLDRESFKTAFKIDKGLKIGGVTPLDDKSLELVLTNSFMQTNVDYTVQIAKIKDLGKPPGELTTNAVVSFTGTPDTTPPVVIDVSLGANFLQLTFNKDLSEESARRENNYALFDRPREQWEKRPLRFNPTLSENRIVRLNFPSALPNGTLRVEYSGVTDLAGNTTNEFREFSTGMSYQITSLKRPEFSNQARTGVLLVLYGRIDRTCEDSRNFQVADLQGNAIPGVDVTGVRMAPSANTTRVSLDLSRRLDKDYFKIVFSKLKLEGEARLQEGEARLMPDY
jgi:hypothetical protein